ncbi:M55 family metallopeptidase [Lacrimispora sp.]|uniref:M55 family metallopeptidase n=1 Tax=Lacrimispora sp. TaxID=2719234 RepID=UPI00345FA037
MKIYISSDIEGISGITAINQVLPGERDYERSRELMTQEVNAAIEGAIEIGATEIVVNDLHGAGTNILIESLNSKAQLIMGPSHKGAMLEGLDSSFDAAIFIGYHSRMNTSGVLSHSFHGGVISDININGKDVGEFYMNACVAGHFNVPVVLVSGDNILEQEVKDVNSPIETVVVKISYGRYAAKCLASSVAFEKIKEKSKVALINARNIDPVKIQGPLEMRVTFLNSGQAESASIIPGTELISPNIVLYSGKTIIDIYRALTAMIKIANSK